jgi:hypothetical protein
MSTTKSKSSSRIQRRKDVYPVRGKHEYGNVKFADPVNNKYPIDTAKHIRAAWSYINHPRDAAKYSKEEVAKIKRRIKAAAKKAGIEISSK